MTPEQRIKQQIIIDHLQNNKDKKCPPINAENIDEYFDALNEDYDMQDDINGFRDSGTDTGLTCEWSRHYESKAVGRKLDDGSWVGWTFWYGGGKHGETATIDWMDDAYDLDVTSEEKVVTVFTFAKKEPS